VSVDLQSNTMFGRISLVLMEDCLVKLEHGRTEDRVRRFMFDSIESVIIWRKMPWGRIAVTLGLFALPGVALFFVGELVTTIFGIFLVALGLGLTAWYLTCRKTTIRILRGGNTHDLSGIFRPSKVRSLRDRLFAQIERAQQQAAATIASPSTEPPPTESPATLPPPDAPAL
jgi:hypothetical protein